MYYFYSTLNKYHSIFRKGGNAVLWPSLRIHKKILRAFFFLLIIFTKSEGTFASHSMGADMTYQCLGGNTYKIRLSFYRDCFGIPASPYAVVNLHSTNCNIDTFAILDPIPGTGQEITPLCPSATSTCNGGTFTGIQEWVYEGVFTFPAQCTDWNLTYSFCCRNAAITTIVNPDWEDINIFSTLNNTICNNSPTFTNKPVPFVCMGQQFCFNHGAFDADGDSLAYTLINPIGNFGMPVQYYPGYSPLQPLNSVPAMTFDYQTGDFCITPQSLEVTVMAVVVSEYRNGILIGNVERDIQITVINCNNILPDLTGINGTNNFTATICADVPYCFNVFSNDVDPGQTVTVTWDQGIPAGSLNTVGAPHPNGTFCWTPTQADAGGTPHCFTATVTDNACPFFGSQTFSYCLTVLNAQVNAGPDLSVNCAGLVNLSAAGSTAYGNLTYQWNNGSTSANQNVGPGTYIVTASNGGCTASDTVLVSPTTGPLAAFNAPPVCVGSAVSFTDMSSIASGNITSWSWNFGDGATSSSQNPTHLYSGPGSFTASLIVTSSVNCSDTVIQTVVVNPIPVPAFNFNNACLGTSISFANSSTPATVGSFWNFGNGTTSTAASPLVTYSNPGAYNVSLVITDAIGCSNSIQQVLNVYAPPQPAFSQAILNPCPGDHVYFTDNSLQNIVSWSWNFGNGQTSNNQNPDITFAPGNYSTQLIVTDANGCTATIAQPVNVNPAFVAGIGPPQSICPGGSTTLTASGGVSYAWNNGLSGSSITVNPTSSSQYVVSVTDANGCIATAQVAVTIYAPSPVNAGNDKAICLGVSTQLTASGVNSYQWSNGSNTQGILVTPSSTTDYIVTGTDNNGCTSSDTVQVSVNPNLVVTIPDRLICPGGTAILDAGYPGSSFAWSTGQQSQTIATSLSGNYTVMVTDANGCTGTAATTVTMGGGGLYNNPTTVGTCDGHYATLDAGNPGNHFSWSSGDTTQDIRVVNAGNYSVTVTDADGCTTSFTSTLIVNPIPTVTYNHPPICAYDTVTFTAITSISSGTISHYLWYFGDGGVSYQVNPTHYYGAPGGYSLKLTVTSDSGCIANYTTITTVNSIPAAAFNSVPVCYGNSTQFSDLSIAGNDTINSWQWNFGDGTVGNTNNPSHQYSVDGNFPVQLIVSTNNGCYDTITSVATVHPLPVVNAGRDSTICSGNNILLGSQPQNNIYYQWTPGTNLNHTNLATANFSGYNNSHISQQYTYQVTATNQYGCSTSDDVTVNVLPVPELTFQTPNAQCLDGNSFNFLPSGYVDINSTILWTFTNDANPSTSYSFIPPPVSYSTTGNHPVVLYYSYGQCPGKPVIDTAIVWQNPQSGFLPTSYEGCAPLTVTFYNAYPQNANNYTWTIDGNSTHEISPAHTFDTPGSYRVRLDVMNEHGCSADPYIIPINIYNIPTAAFTNTPEYGRMYESLIEFQNNSVGAVQYDWNFGDGNTADFFDGNHIYGDTGSFVIALIVTSNHGCMDTAYGRVRIEDGFSFYVPNAFTPNDDGVNDSFQGYGTFIHAYEMWIYDRWGKIIYHTEDYNKPWDGRMHSIVQNDTYVYRIRVTDTHEKDHIYIGSVSLVK